jgi:hypothetical protein
MKRDGGAMHGVVLLHDCMCISICQRGLDGYDRLCFKLLFGFGSHQ